MTTVNTINTNESIQILQALEASMLLLDAARQALLDVQTGAFDKNTLETLIDDIDFMVPRPQNVQ